MKIWLLKPIGSMQKGWGAGVSNLDACIVRADSEIVARCHAALESLNEGPESWLDSTITSCEEIPQVGPSQVLLLSERIV